MTVSRTTIVPLTMIGFFGAALATGPAGSQSFNAPAPSPQQTNPSRPNIIPPPPRQQQSRNPSQGNDLSRSGGVIAPPSTGNEDVVPPPSDGAPATPVIPPPGTRGGNQNVEPK
jgi:hypothetical protein